MRLGDTLQVDLGRVGGVVLRSGHAERAEVVQRGLAEAYMPQPRHRDLASSLAFGRRRPVLRAGNTEEVLHRARRRVGAKRTRQPAHQGFNLIDPGVAFWIVQIDVDRVAQHPARLHATAGVNDAARRHPAIDQHVGDAAQPHALVRERQCLVRVEVQDDLAD
jgi:hypothetical protein